jgi:hypothetical protein
VDGWHRGDLNRGFHALNSDTGKVLWEVPLGGMIMSSTITYAANGKQYVAVFTGDDQSGTGNVLANFSKQKPGDGQDARYVFTLHRNSYRAMPASYSAGLCGLFVCGEIGDEVVRFLRINDTTIGHAIPLHLGLRIDQIGP